MPDAKPTSASSLRFIVGLLPARTRRLRRLAVGAVERALQVVEDEPDGRRGAGGRCDPAGAVADDEDTACRRRGLELRDIALGAEAAGPGEQVGAGLREPLGRALVGE